MKKLKYISFFFFLSINIYGQETINEINLNDSIVLPIYSFSDNGGIKELVDSLEKTSFMEHTYYDIIIGESSNVIYIIIEDSGDPNDIIDRVLYNKGYYKRCNVIGCVQYKGLIMSIVNVNNTDSCINMFFMREDDKTIVLFKKEPPALHDPVDDTWFFYHHPKYFLYMNGKFVPAKVRSVNVSGEIGIEILPLWY